MFSRDALLCIRFATAFALAVGSVGCVGNKNKDVAEAPVAAPPPAAYPESSGSVADNSAYSDSGSYAQSDAATSAATNRSSTPSVPAFKLRDGEQLMPYKIQPGDNLGKIAGKYNTSVSRIMAANSMSSDKIYAGKTLQVPTSAPPTGMALQGTGASAPTTPSSPSYPSTAPSSPYPSPTAPSPSPYPSSSPAPSYGTPSVAQRSPYSPPVSSGPAPGYGSTSSAPAYTPPSSSSPYPSPTAPPTPPVVKTPTNPSSTSYPRAQAPSVPAQPGGSFPTPSLGGSGQIQFSN